MFERFQHLGESTALCTDKVFSQVRSVDKSLFILSFFFVTSYHIA